MTLVYKGENAPKADPASYGPVSLTSICSKLFEHIFVRSMLTHLGEHSILTDVKHGFRAERSYETQFVTLVQDLADKIAGGGQVSSTGDASNSAPCPPPKTCPDGKIHARSPRLPTTAGLVVACLFNLVLYNVL